MNKLSETELITTSIEDLNNLIPSSKNRSSFMNVEEGAKRGCSRIATLIGRKRVIKWAKMFDEKKLPFSKIAHLPVWDNGNGTYTLGDGHTRIDAIKFLCTEKGFLVPNISLIVENSKFASIEEFENEIIVMNGTFNGKKWDLCEKVDFLMRQGNEYAKQIFDLFDYFYEKTNKDVAFNLVTNIFLDCQGTGKDSVVLDELEKLEESNKYAYDFANFFIELNDNIQNNKQATKINIFDQYVFQALFNLFMCVAPEHHDKINRFYSLLIEALSNSTTKEKIMNSKRSAFIADEIMDRIYKSKKLTKDDSNSWCTTIKKVRTKKGMTDIKERGGRCIKFKED